MINHMNNTKAKITVIMPAYNCESYIGNAIESILNQTYTNFLFYILDDCSRDSTYQKAKSYSAIDSRITVWKNSKNIGLAASLNLLLDKVSTEYIARMDSDDESFPDRLARQLLFLEKHQVDMCGTWMQTMSRLDGKLLRFPQDNDEIKAYMLFQAPIAHPTLLIRSNILKNYRYNTDVPHAEDYDLWVRMSPEVTMSNIPEPLYLYRKHRGQVSKEHAQTQWETASKIRLQYLDKINIPCTKEERVIHTKVRQPTPPASREEIEKIEEWLIKLEQYYSGNKSSQLAIEKQWFHVAIRSTHYGLWLFRKYTRSILVKSYKISVLSKLELLLLCLFRVKYGSPIYRFLERISLS